MPEIVERREVVVRDGDRELVFVAEPDEGRLTILDRGEDADDEVCAIRLGDRDELTAFLEGLRRVLVAQGLAGDQAPPRPGAAGQAGQAGQARPPGRALGSGGRPSPASDADRDRGQAPSAAPDRDDRSEQIERARRRNPSAFAAWTPDEEQRLLEAHRQGESVSALARAHGRSERAIEMRLSRLGATG